MLKVGDKAPLKTAIMSENEEAITLAEVFAESGASVLVVYFYPKDNTPGCTKQACGFRDINAEIESLGAKVVGVSKDSLVSHTKFRTKHELSFMLLSDPELELQNGFGVWVEKSMYGRKYMGTQRATFVIDKSGEVVKVWEKANAAKNPLEVLEFVKQYTQQKLS